MWRVVLFWCCDSSVWRSLGPTRRREQERRADFLGLNDLFWIRSRLTQWGAAFWWTLRNGFMGKVKAPRHRQAVKEAVSHTAVSLSSNDSGIVGSFETSAEGWVRTRVWRSCMSKRFPTLLLRALWPGGFPWCRDLPHRVQIIIAFWRTVMSAAIRGRCESEQRSLKRHWSHERASSRWCSHQTHRNCLLMSFN